MWPWRAIIDADPNIRSTWCWLVVADDYIRAGQWLKVKPYLLRWADLVPPGDDGQFYLAPLLARAEAKEAWQRLSQNLLTRFASTDKAEWAERASKFCLILPVTGEMLESASRLADRAVALAEKHWVLSWAHVAAGMGAYRRGNFNLCIDLCDKALERESDNVGHRNAQAHYFRAMALARLSKVDEAKTSFQKANVLLRDMQAAAKTCSGNDGLHDLAICELLQTETAQVLQKAGTQKQEVRVETQRKP